MAPRGARLRRTANEPGSKRRAIESVGATVYRDASTHRHHFLSVDFLGLRMSSNRYAIGSMLRNAWIALLALESPKLAMPGVRWPKTGSGSL